MIFAATMGHGNMAFSFLKGVILMGKFEEPCLIEIEKFEGYCEYCANRKTRFCDICEWSNYNMCPTYVKWTVESFNKEKRGLCEHILPDVPEFHYQDCKVQSVPVDEMISNSAQTLIAKIAVEVGDLKDKAFIDAMRKYAEKENIDLTLLDDAALKEILTLGIKEYRKIHGENEIIGLDIGNGGDFTRWTTPITESQRDEKKSQS